MSKSNRRSGPGKLAGENSILLHTLHGMYLFDGRDENKETGKFPIIGVSRFYGSAKQAYFDAMADDPWADWWLVKIDNAIEQAEIKLADLLFEVKKVYPKTPSISIRSSHSIEPETRPLEFAIPSYPYRMAYLVVDCDLFICDILNLFHAGRLKRHQRDRYLNLAGKAVRAALQSATGYRHQGVTRNDVKANNPKARKATQLMGQVPEDILNMKIRSDYAPELKQYDQDNGIQKIEESQQALKVAKG